MNVIDFINSKNKKKITMVTCYDASFASVLEKTSVDAVLVGDSVAMVIYGKKDTVSATVDMIALHVEAVRTNYSGFLVADLPFLSMQKNKTDFILDVKKLMSAGANAIKIESIQGEENKIESLIHAGVPVMGHIGLTPQFVNSLGGFKVQGRTEKQKKFITSEAKCFEKLGVFSIVLECLPHTLALEITASLSIPTIGIGAGETTDGQILVLQDLLGLNSHKFKFVKKYEDFFLKSVKAIDFYCDEVRSLSFPKEEHRFS